ncbi:MAG TPA: tetratricopeptide repeat protein [Bryobacteraceae bacterium]
MPANPCRRALPFALLLATAGLAPAADEWIGLATPHFRLYTTSDPKTAAAALQTFESARYFFEKSGIFHSVPSSVVQIVAFRSEQEYRAYGINPGACGYYQRTRRADYIVMRDLAPEHHQIGVHEYTHFVFEHSGLTLPLWLNEGLADLYSSVTGSQGHVVLGRAPFGRVYTLEKESWIDLGTLLDVGRDSQYYSQSQKMLLFYAESWALTHMLALSQDYAAAFPKFVELISSGVSARESLAKIYGKGPDQVMADLRAYISRRQLPTHVFDLDLAAAEVEPRPIAAPREQADLALADLAAFNPTAEAAGAAALNSFSGQYPDSPEAEESLGYLALRHNRTEEARLHFQKAVDRHSTAPDVIFYLAHLDASAGAPPDRVIALLNRALEINPGYYQARLELGLVAARAKKFELAAAALTAAAQSGNEHPEHAYVVSYTLAYCYAQLHQPERAFEYAEKAAHAVRNSQDEEQTANLLRYIERDRQRLSAAARPIR